MNFNVSIHGVTKAYNNEIVTITKVVSEGKGTVFHIVKTLNLSLKDFGVIVKPLKMGFVSIGVKDTVTIVIDAYMMSN